MFFYKISVWAVWRPSAQYTLCWVWWIPPNSLYRFNMLLGGGMAPGRWVLERGWYIERNPDQLSWAAAMFKIAWTYKLVLLYLHASFFINTWSTYGFDPSYLLFLCLWPSIPYILILRILNLIIPIWSNEYACVCYLIYLANQPVIIVTPIYYSSEANVNCAWGFRKCWGLGLPAEHA